MVKDSQYLMIPSIDISLNRLINKGMYCLSCSVVVCLKYWQSKWPVLKKFYNCNDRMLVIYNHNDNGQYYKTMILANRKACCKVKQNLWSSIMIAKHLQCRSQKINIFD
jgi:hypothetical protein